MACRKIEDIRHHTARGVTRLESTRHLNGDPGWKHGHDGSMRCHRRSVFGLSAVLLLLCCRLAGQTAVIQGTLVGYDGKPIPMAQVHVAWPEDHVIKSVEAGPDGHFRLETNARGLFLVQFTGVWHKRTEVPLFLDPGSTVSLHVRLTPHYFLEHPESVKLLGDFKDSNTSQTILMTQDDEGRYTATVETSRSKVSYELLGVTDDGASVNGTQSEGFEYDGGGDYRSIVSTHEGRAVIVYDPRQAPRDRTAAQVQFADPASAAARLAKAYDRMIERREAFGQAYRDFRASGRPMADFNYDYTAGRQEIERAFSSETAPAVRQMLLLSYLDMGYGSNGAEIEPSWGQRALSEIPATSPLWVLEPQLVSVAVYAAGPAAGTPYVNALITNHPDEKLRARIRRQLGPDRKIRIGAALPHFEVPLLGEPAGRLTSNDLRGKVYLIDFWATWCEPCIDEIPNMQKAYDLYGRDGFALLSISFDDSPETVAKFRKQKYPMPWQNGFAKDGFSGPVAKDFDLTGLPSPILVDRSGKIIALEMDLRGHRLFSTLERELRGH
ncbi:MAG: redoxin domain-containing protein [Candidatus Sulfotelmatobacter sp.]